MLGARASFVLKLPLLLLILLPLACHLTNQEGQGTLGIVGDSSWTAHDRLLVLLEDGRGTDTLFDGKLLGTDTLARLPAGGYGGGQALFIIQGFRNGELAYEEHRSYDGSRQKVILIDIPFDGRRLTASPDLDLRPDQVRIYVGGEAKNLEVVTPALPGSRALAWKTGNPAVATVSADGVLSPVGVGATYVQVGSGDTLRDASAVRVIRDIPVVDAGAPDTTVPAGAAVTFHVTVTQEYGDVAAFAWDLNSDGVFEDSAAGSPGQTRFATAPRTFGTGDVKVRFRVRDGEGNQGEAAKLVKVSASAPNIDSLKAQPVVVSIKDTVAFAALVTGSGAALRSFAWDFDGDGTNEVTGSLQGERAPVAGAYAYTQPKAYLARLMVEDVNAVMIYSDVSVTVKLDRPVADAGTNRTALPGAQVRLQGSGTDTLGRIVSRDWKCGTAEFTAAGDSGVHVFTAPPAAGTTDCVFRVTDDDNLTAEDTLKVVVDAADAPSILSFTPADTTFSIKDSVAFKASVAAGTADLKAYVIDVDGDGKADLQGTLSGRTGEIRIGRRFPTAARFDVSLTVEDQSGKTAMRLARIQVILDPPKARAGNDTTVVAGTRVNLRGTASDSLGSVAYREWKIGSGLFTRVSGGDTSFNVPITTGTLVCVFKATDDDDQSAVDTVRVTVSPSRVAALSDLTVSVGTLAPTFSAQTYAYAVTVPNATASLTVTPSVASGVGATIRVNGAVVNSGLASSPISLPTSVTVITIQVTAQDTAVKKPYTVTVTRASGASANLSALTSSSGNLVPGFSPDTTLYSLSVTNAAIRLTPTAAVAGATIRVKGVPVTSGTASAAIDLTIGLNPIPVQVTAPDSVTTRNYTVNVTRISTDPSLSALAFPAGGSLNTPFVPGTTAYTVTATATMSAFSVRPTAAAAGATLTVDSTAVTSGQQSGDLAFPLGRSSHTIVVTAPDGVTTRTYNLTVDRPVHQSLRFGYALVDSYLANHELTVNVHNPAGKVDFVRDGTGTYTLHFRGLATLGGAPGIVHATAYTDGTQGAYCKVLDWSGSADLTARIACFTMGGLPVDAMVSVLVLFPRNMTSGQNAIAWADQHTRTLDSPYELDNPRTSSSGGPITITRTLIGEYSVQLPGLGGLSGGAPMITAVGAGSARCNVISYNGDGPDMSVNVRCITASGPPADAQFNLSVMQPYTGTAEGVAAAMVDTSGTTQYAFNNGANGGSISLAKVSTGHWQVTFSGLAARGGTRGGNVQVRPRTTGTVSCQTGGWTVQGSSLVATVKCFDFSGLLADRIIGFYVWALK